MTLPNTLTIFRVVLTLVFAFFLYQNGLLSKVAAAVIFTLASLTDYFDGYLAKKNNLITNFGKMMDPIADKILILTAFFIFTRMHLIALWMFVIIFVREVLITGWRLVNIRKGKVMAAERAGKYKTISQIVAISFVLIFMILKDSRLSHNWSEGMISGWHYGIHFFTLIAVVLTLFSGVHYFWNNSRFLHVS
jgi:CDP-diacylglycerol---glycerol-3-phosphate 3-phosphatidyltransferase